MSRIRLRAGAAREHFARHVRSCAACEPRTGALCTAGEVLARLVALAVVRQGPRPGKGLTRPREL